MKKNIVIIAGLAMLSTNAFASKARMEALGQDSRLGSNYISDSRSIFRNAASLNNMKNYLVTEWGAGAVADTTTAPRAEGGFFREMGAFAYGLYLGNGVSSARYTGAGATTNLFLDHQNPLDLFISGDMGVKWGAKLHYANSKDEVTTAGVSKKNSAFGLGFGAEQGDLEGYLNLDLSDKSEGATVAGDVWENKPGVTVGGSYKYSGMTFFASYVMTKEDVTAGSGSTLGGVSRVSGTGNTIAAGATVSQKSNTITLGAGRIHEINPTSRIFTDAKLVLLRSEISGSSTATTNGKTTTNTLPLTIGMEAEATSWLTLRGSIHQNVIVGETKNTAGKKVSAANSTTVDTGVTLNFGKLKLDGTIGTTPNARQGGTLGAREGVLATDNLMSRVAASYSF